MKNLTKHQLKEAGFLLIMFVVLAVSTIIGKYGTQDFPLGRSIIGSVLFGLSLIFLEVFLQQKVLKRTKPIWRNVFVIFYIYSTFVVLLLLLGYATEIFKNGKPFAVAIRMSLPEMYPGGVWDILINLFFIVSFIAVITIAHRSLGPKVMKNFLLGSYDTPRTEEKIFMFLDLASSTRIAEKLGHLKYSAFIKDFFASLDESILETKGTIYQYVGDEVVIVWDKEIGIKKLNCMNFFFLAQDEIQNRSKYFWNKYHIIPQFRAGLHFGKVSVTEVGTLKKEIAYHGDPVNTSARICLHAKQTKSEFLMSEAILKLLPHPNGNFELKHLGEQQLMGKDKLIELYEVGRTEN